MRSMIGWLSYLVARPKHFKRRVTGCCLIFVLGILLACGLLFGLSFLLVQLAVAQTTETPQEVLLLIDNSNSMFEKDGPGSDPNLLRIQAARLFITYLGVDSGGVLHRLGVIFFGGEARLVAPLTTLADDARRDELIDLIDNPERMAWTNPQAALELAEQTFRHSRTSGSRAVVLLTDGKPEWTTTPTEQEMTQTIARLRTVAGRFAAQNIPLFIILLQNSTTEADPEIEQRYIPLWQDMAAMTPTGRFYRARHSDALLDIYHNIVVTLTDRQTAGVVLQTQVQTQTIQQLWVEPNLQQVTFVIRKSDPALQVELVRPDERPVNPAEAGVQYGGRLGQSLEEIWSINQPPPGVWTVRINGRGTVTLWKDFYPAPATPTVTPSPTATLTPTATPRPSATATPTPTLTPTSTTPPAVAKPVPTLQPTGRPTSLPTATAPATGSVSNGPLIRWVVWPSLVLVVGGAGWYWRHTHQTQPLLSGTLRRVTAPNQVGPAATERIDLDTTGRRDITLGPDPKAYLHLPDLPEAPTPTIRLVARLGPDHQLGVSLLVPETNEARPVLVNKMPVQREWLLQDGDVITMGAYRFKYENLRQRASGYPGQTPR